MWICASHANAGTFKEALSDPVEFENGALCAAWAVERFSRTKAPAAAKPKLSARRRGSNLSGDGEFFDFIRVR